MGHPPGAEIQAPDKTFLCLPLSRGTQEVSRFALVLQGTLQDNFIVPRGPEKGFKNGEKLSVLSCIFSTPLEVTQPMCKLRATFFDFMLMNARLCPHLYLFVV